MIDPFDWRDNTIGVTLQESQKIWDKEINAKWILDTIPQSLIVNKYKDFKVIFLDTTQYEAELESLPYLCNLLVKGGY